MKMRFEIWRETPSANVFKRMHWAKVRIQRSIWAEEFLLCLRKRITLKPPVKIKITSYRSRLLDFDNLVGGTKLLVDGLRDAGVIEDDSPKKLIWELPEQFIVPKDERRTVIELEEIEERKEVGK